MKFKEIQEACWKGYRQAGMKEKGDRQVPNCVPVEEVKTGPEMTLNDLLYTAAAKAIHQAGLEGVPMDYEEAIKKAAKIYRIPYTPSELPKLLAQRAEIDRKLAMLKQGKQVAKARRKEKLAPTPAGAEEYWKTHALPTDRIKPPAKTLEETEAELAEDLKKWFKEKWVRFGPDGKIRGDCARGSSKEGKPKCLPQSKAHALGKKGRASAAAKKRREDPNPERRGAAKNVATKVNELSPATLQSYADKRGAQVAAMKANNPDAMPGSPEWNKIAVPAQQVGRAKQKIARQQRQQGVAEGLIYSGDTWEDVLYRINVLNDIFGDQKDLAATFEPASQPEWIPFRDRILRSRTVLDTYAKVKQLANMNVPLTDVEIEMLDDVAWDGGGGPVKPAGHWGERDYDWLEDLYAQQFAVVQHLVDQRAQGRGQNKTKSGQTVHEQDVAEGNNDDWYDDADEFGMPGSEFFPDDDRLRDGDYVRDRQDGEYGEIFRMSGDPSERRVRILDRDGKGWYISPERLVAVDRNDPDIMKYFGKRRHRDMDEQLDASGGRMYQAKEKFLLRHNGKDIAFFNTAEEAKQAAQDLMRELKGFASVHRVMREQDLDEKQDACYRKVKSRYKVWPSAYASGALVQCRKKGAANWGNKKK